MRRTAKSGEARRVRRRSRREGRGGDFDGGVGEVEGFPRVVPSKAVDLPIIEGGEEGLVVGGDEVDELEFEGFLVAVGLRVADGVLGGFDVAAAAGDVGAEEGGCVVFDFGAEDGVDLAAFDDGVGGAGVGAGGQGGDIGGFEEEEDGGSGSGCRLGRSKYDDGDGGCFDGLDHGAVGVEEAAGGAEGDDDGGVMVGGSFLQAALEIVGGDGLDGVVDGEFEDGGLGGVGGVEGRGEEGGEEGDEDEEFGWRFSWRFRWDSHGRLCPRAWRA